MLNNHSVTALLHTGSCVSIISQTFYENYLQDRTELQPTKDIFNTECADGQTLPYLGFIEIDLTITKGLPSRKPQPCLLPVVLDTNYSPRTPVVLGTNILKELLEECKSNFGDQFLQKTDLHVPWYLCFRTMVVRDSTLHQNKNRKAVDIQAYLDEKLDHTVTAPLIQPSEDASIPSSIDITPGVIKYDYGKKLQYYSYIV